MTRDSVNDDVTETLLAVQVQFDLAIEIFQSITQQARAGDPPAASETTKAANALVAATQTLIKQKLRIEDERKRHQGLRARGELDLDEARDQVGRLLDRFRAAGGADDVPE